ncbi:MAG: restriction endonuclease [Defluviitaleaceae bacterium]|nr:restriction endonuclease [Defluviitaleaceae bacterium]
MDSFQLTTKIAVFTHGRKAIGIPLGVIDKTGRLKTGKGAVGTMIEESWFGIKPNNDPEPDFPEAGVELKVTPYVKSNNGIRAKERLVCNIINYMEEHSDTFVTSSFWHKCNTLLIMTYMHKDGVDKRDFEIDEVVLFNFPESDLEIIIHDWETIMTKIRAGKAHELSEGDTLYLGACTKGKNSATVRHQPFSSIPAKQRAYSLKQSYMTSIINRYIFGGEADEYVVKDPELLNEQSFQDYVSKKVAPYIGWTQESLLLEFGLDDIAKYTPPSIGLIRGRESCKNINERILACMLGVKGRIAATDEFKKASIIPKTIRIQRNNRIKESMSFPTFRFGEIIQEEWEESNLMSYLAPAIFLFVIFKENNLGEYVFERVKFWNIPVTDLDEVEKVWHRTVDTIRRGVKLTIQGKRVINDLPKSTDNHVAHIRPHSSRSAYRFDDVVIGKLGDAYELPDGRWMTKQCFWFNNSYVESIIKE